LQESLRNLAILPGRSLTCFGKRFARNQVRNLPTSSGTAFGNSTLVVIDNGIPSKPVGIIVEQ
jgi:hypothetical protein